MTDTTTPTPTATDQTATPTDQTKVRRSPAPRDVDYTIELIDGDLPERAERRSPLEDALDQIKSNEKAHGIWVLFGRYRVSSAATAAKHQLEIRHGRTPNVEGFEFATRRLDDGKTGIFTRYSPDRVVAGAKEEHDRVEAEVKAKNKQRAAERKAAKAAGENGQGAPSTSPAPTPSPAPAAQGAQPVATPPPPPPAGSPETKPRKG